MEWFAAVTVMTAATTSTATTVTMMDSFVNGMSMFRRMYVVRYFNYNMMVMSANNYIQN